MMRVLLVLMLFLATSVTADEITILPLQHRLPEQVLPTLQPLIAPGGSIVGANNQLFVRTTPDNLAQIQQVLAALDTPLQRLLISVKQSLDNQQQQQRAGIDRLEIDTQSNPGVRLKGSLSKSSTTLSDQISQQVQTIDGSPATIYLGESFPLAMIWHAPDHHASQQLIQYVDVGSGFTATPRISGQDVVVTIEPVQQIRNDSQILGSTLSTEIRGPLGSWIALGGSTQQQNGASQQLLNQSSSQANQQQQVWLKVDQLR